MGRFAGEPTEYDKSLVNIDPDKFIAARRIRNIFHATPEEVRGAGINWYANVHDAAAKAAAESGKSIRAAAGLVASVSPNMDWERNNINAFGEVEGMTGRQWATIRESARIGRENRSFNSKNQAAIESGLVQARPGGRTDEARGILQGLSISRASDSDLLKADRIWNQGEDFEDVLDRHTAPKTNSFARNIWQPGKPGPITVDGRHSDIIVDAMRPWQAGRGIGSAALKTPGRRTRYEEYEDATRLATAGINKRLPAGQNLLPHQVQAVVWEYGKEIERGFTGAGKGDDRTGQSYERRLKAFSRGQLA